VQVDTERQLRLQTTITVEFRLISTRKSSGTRVGGTERKVLDV